ncbi:hypothetical protein LIER_36890 [Lithospermum erythrorhizon]|uniref:Gag-pol polyprotein n=1 Tax=Lithospermum erythrorhizon TaxID=34254 RepID=A0AAV3PGD4_LITER
MVSHVVFTSLKATAWTGQYFDSGCSRYMTGNKSYLSNIEKVRNDYVTFGGREKGRIIGKWSLNIEGLPRLEGVLLVEGLTTNLISIIQLCDSGMKVSFSKEAYCVNNPSDQLIMQESISPDNYYLWTPQKALSSKIQEDDKLWHKKLGDTNYRNIQQLVAKESVRGLPNLVIKEKICGECQVEKQTKLSH